MRYNVLQLPVVGVLEPSTVYPHQCKFNELMVIFPRSRQLLVGAVRGMVGVPRLNTAYVSAVFLLLLSGSAGEESSLPETFL